MPSLFSHAAVVIGIGAAVLPRATSRRAWWLGLACALLPDLDVLAFTFGIPYAHPLGHRGFTHSLVCAFALALLAYACVRQSATHPGDRARVFAFLLLASLSHGLLDALTNGGLGVAFFWPMDQARYFFPLTPIEVSPIGAAFFSHRGWLTIQSELLWIGLPSAIMLIGARRLRGPFTR